MNATTEKRYEKYKIDYIYREGRSFICAKCKMSFPETAFGIKRNTFRGRRSICNGCRAGERVKLRNRKRDDFISSRGNVCERCKATFPAYVYDIHHMNGRSEDEKGKDMFLLNDPDLQEKLKNCQVLCVNCHRIVHNEQRQDRGFPL